jgi:hypothetical protein
MFIQALGAQPALELQTSCLEYVAEFFALTEGRQLSAAPPFDLEPGASVCFDNHLLLGGWLPSPVSWADYPEIGTYDPDRLVGSSSAFLFDAKHSGLLCSVAPKASPQGRPVTRIRPGVHVRIPHARRDDFPLELVFLHILEARFIPGLQILCKRGPNHERIDELLRLPGGRAPAARGASIPAIAPGLSPSALAEFTLEVHAQLQSITAAERALQTEKDRAQDWASSWFETTGKLKDELRFVPIDELEEVPVRTKNLLKNAGINRLGQLLLHSGKELLGIPRFGRFSLHCVRENLAKEYKCILH